MALTESHLHTAIGSDKLILQVWVPEPQLGQVLQQMLVDDCELAAQHSPHIDVAGVWLEALIVA